MCWIRASGELLWRFRSSTNDDYDDDHDGTRMTRIKRIIRI